MAENNTRWMTSLALRDNLFQGSPPHVPILVEDLPKYVSLIDYEENCVKTIHTIGKISPNFISSITPGQNVKFPFSMDYMSPFDVYEETNDARLLVQKVTAPVVKVYGFLQHRDDEIVLVASYVMDVKDAKASLETIMALSRLARRQYRQYCRTEEMNELVKREWDRMGTQGTRK